MPKIIENIREKLLVEAKEIDKTCKTGFLYAPNRLITLKVFWRAVAFAKSINADAIHPQFLFVNEKLVKDAHKAGIMVNPWTVNKEKDMRKLLSFGVDGLITDVPNIAKRVIEEF